MARAFFDELNDALVGLVPDDVGRYSARVTGHNVKVWFDEEREHYEAQALSGGRFEVGFHAEHRQPARNQSVLAGLMTTEAEWRRELGDDPVVGAFVDGRPEGWRRISEVWEEVDLDDPEVAIDAADRLATYISALEPARRG